MPDTDFADLSARSNFDGTAEIATLKSGEAAPQRMALSEVQPALTTRQKGVLAQSPHAWEAAVHAVGDMAASDGKDWICIKARTITDTDRPEDDATGWKQAGTVTEAQLTAVKTTADSATNAAAVAARLASAALPKTGGTLTGTLTLSGAPSNDLEAATKKYVDDSSGGSSSGSSVGGPPVELHKDTTAPTHAADNWRAVTLASAPARGSTLSVIIRESNRGTLGTMVFPAVNFLDLPAIDDVGTDKDLENGEFVLAFMVADPGDRDLATISVRRGVVGRYSDTSMGIWFDGNVTNPLLTITEVPQGTGTSTSTGGTDQTARDAAAAAQATADAALPLAGGTMTGRVTLSGGPTKDLHAASKKYADAGDAKNLPLAGGTLTGALTLSGDPTSDNEAANKKYVDENAGNGSGASAAELEAIDSAISSLDNLTRDLHNNVSPTDWTDTDDSKVDLYIVKRTGTIALSDSDFTGGGASGTVPANAGSNSENVNVYIRLPIGVDHTLYRAQFVDVYTSNGNTWISPENEQNTTPPTASTTHQYWYVNEVGQAPGATALEVQIQDRETLESTYYDGVIPGLSETENQVVALQAVTADLEAGKESTGWSVVTSNAQGGVAVDDSSDDLATAKAASYADHHLEVGGKISFARIPVAANPDLYRTELTGYGDPDYYQPLTSWTKLGEDATWAYYIAPQAFGSGVLGVYLWVTGDAAHVGQTVYSGQLANGLVEEEWLDGDLQKKIPPTLPAADTADKDYMVRVKTDGTRSWAEFVSLLPDFPAAGSRDDKIAIFNSNTLRWENFPTIRELPASPATGSRDGKFLGFENDVLDYREVPGGSGGDSGSGAALLFTKVNDPDETTNPETKPTVNLSSQTSDVGPPLDSFSDLIWIALNYTRSSNSVWFNTFVRKADLEISLSSSVYRLQLQGVGGDHLQIWTTQVNGVKHLAFSEQSSTISACELWMYNVSIAGGGGDSGGSDVVDTTDPLVDLSKLPDADDFEVGRMIAVNNQFYLNSDTDHTVENLFQGTIGRERFATFSNEVWRGIANSQSPNGFTTDGGWTANPNNAVSIMIADNERHIRVGMKKSVYEAAKGSAFATDDKIAIKVTFPGDGDKDEAVLAYYNQYTREETYILWQHRHASSNYNVYTADAGEAFTLEFFTVDGDGNATTTPLLTHTTNAKHWVEWQPDSSAQAGRNLADILELDLRMGAVESAIAAGADTPSVLLDRDAVAILDTLPDPASDYTSHEYVQIQAPYKRRFPSTRQQGSYGRSSPMPGLYRRVAVADRGPGVAVFKAGALQTSAKTYYGFQLGNSHEGGLSYSGFAHAPKDFGEIILNPSESGLLWFLTEQDSTGLWFTSIGINEHIFYGCMWRRVRRLWAGFVNNDDGLGDGTVRPHPGNTVIRPDLFDPSSVVIAGVKLHWWIDGTRQSDLDLVTHGDHLTLHHDDGLTTKYHAFQEIVNVPNLHSASGKTIELLPLLDQDNSYRILGDLNPAKSWNAGQQSDFSVSVPRDAWDTHDETSDDAAHGTGITHTWMGTDIYHQSLSKTTSRINELASKSVFGSHIRNISYQANQAAYDALSSKSGDTLYFVDGGDLASRRIYVGSKQWK